MTILKPVYQIHGHLMACCKARTKYKLASFFGAKSIDKIN